MEAVCNVARTGKTGDGKVWVLDLEQALRVRTGETGPDAGYISFGSTLEAMGGLAAITGYRGGPPVASGVEVNYPDQVVALFAASMVMTAWHARTREWNSPGPQRTVGVVTGWSGVSSHRPRYSIVMMIRAPRPCVK